MAYRDFMLNGNDRHRAAANGPKRLLLPENCAPRS